MVLLHLKRLRKTVKNVAIGAAQLHDRQRMIRNMRPKNSDEFAPHTLREPFWNGELIVVVIPVVSVFLVRCFLIHNSFLLVQIDVNLRVTELVSNAAQSSERGARRAITATSSNAHIQRLATAFDPIESSNMTVQD